jgi:hypothetical protein
VNIWPMPKRQAVLSLDFGVLMPNEDLPFGKPGQSEGKLSCPDLGGGEGEVTPRTYRVYYALVD